jgi:Zn finger protein HypA/HybF involved in hydrogenase expression
MIQAVFECQDCKQIFHRVVPIPESKELLCPKCKSNDVDCKWAVPEEE